MNSISKNLVLVALSLAAAGAAVAGDRAADSRAQQEESAYVFNPLVQSHLTRAEVRAEYDRARRDGSLATARDAELSSSVAVAPVQPRERAEVRAEARESSPKRVNEGL